MKRTVEEWRIICSRISVGYIPDSGKEDTYLNGVLYVNKYLRPHNLLREGLVIVDIGCGNGRLAMGMVEEPITYYGLEIIPGSVKFCQKAFEMWPNFQFKHLDIKNGHYYSKNSVSPSRVIFPLKEDLADLVIISSVFTHLVPSAAVKRYISEITRILKPGGILFSTWLRSPPNQPSQEESRTVYAEDEIRGFLSGLEWKEDWGGTKPVRGDQWMVICQKEIH